MKVERPPSDPGTTGVESTADSAAGEAAANAPHPSSKVDTPADLRPDPSRTGGGSWPVGTYGALPPPPPGTATAPLDPDAALPIPDGEARRQLVATLTRLGGSATDEDLRVVLAELEKLPLSMLQEMHRFDLRVVVCRDSVTDHLEALRGVRPRGWPPGSTWDDVAATYDPGPKQVVVSTRQVDGRRALPARGSGHGSFNVLLHEIAHGIDFAKNLTRQPAFLEAYETDLETLLPYERQPGAAGREEAFAEAFARYYGGDESFASERPHMFRYFELLD